jgi:ElaB/YqjD/DUF883 family membrane-anchored ribosome-binding protein
MNTALNQLDKAKGKLAADFKNTISDSGDLLKAAASVSGEGVGAADYIRANPWTAVGIAVAAGLVLGLIVAKR